MVTLGGNNNNSGTAVPLTDVPQLYAESICEAYLGCIGPVWDLFLAGQDCVELFQARVEDGFGEIEAAVEAGRIAYDGTKIQACADELSGKSCAQLLDRESATCRQAMAGTIALSEDCTLDDECAGEAYCKSTDSCPGVCTALEAAGGDCTDDDHCRSGLNCNDDSQTCQAPAGPGDLCNSGEPDCEPGYFCAGGDEDNAVPGNCRVYEEVFSVTLGSACDFAAGTLCQSNLVCEISIGAMGEIAGTCKNKVGSGQACHVSIPDACPSDEYCALPGDGIAGGILDGTCTPKPGAGEPCAPGLGDDKLCAAGTACDADTCRSFAHLGQSCSESAVCLSERCEGNTCVSGNSCE